MYILRKIIGRVRAGSPANAKTKCQHVLYLSKGEPSRIHKDTHPLEVQQTRAL